MEGHNPRTEDVKYSKDGKEINAWSCRSFTAAISEWSAFFFSFFYLVVYLGVWSNVQEGGKTVMYNLYRSESAQAQWSQGDGFPQRTSVIILWHYKGQRRPEPSGCWTEKENRLHLFATSNSHAVPLHVVSREPESWKCAEHSIRWTPVDGLPSIPVVDITKHNRDAYPRDTHHLLKGRPKCTWHLIQMNKRLLKFYFWALLF